MIPKILTNVKYIYINNVIHILIHVERNETDPHQKNCEPRQPCQSRNAHEYSVNSSVHSLILILTRLFHVNILAHS